MFGLGLFHVCLHFQRYPFLFFFFFRAHFTWSVSQWVLCIVHGTHHLFDQQAFYVGIGLSICPVHNARDSQISFFNNFVLLEMDLMTLFTHLKIILLQCF